MSTSHVWRRGGGGVHWIGTEARSPSPYGRPLLGAPPPLPLSQGHTHLLFTYITKVNESPTLTTV